MQISTGFASWQLYCTASSSGRQLNFAALNRGRHLCSAGRPSRWALAHILVLHQNVHCVRLAAGRRTQAGDATDRAIVWAHVTSQILNMLLS